MDEAIERAVHRAITLMHHDLSHPMTIDDLARAAMFSKFHFSRVFTRVTGVSPRRFLSAIRLQEAKRLLVSTSLSVTTISNRVGYTSVSTFSGRFKASVGVAPVDYRRLGGMTSRIPIDHRHQLSRPRGTVTGRVHSPARRFAPIYVGLFPDPIPQGRPVACAVLEGASAFQLTQVPPGSWYLLAHAVADDRVDDVEGALNRPTEDLVVASGGRISVPEGTHLGECELMLRPVRVFDPPVLLALLDVRSVSAAMLAG